MTGSVGHQAQPQEREVERLVGAQEGSVHAFMFPAGLKVQEIASLHSAFPNLTWPIKSELL
jgi:hypothetical protein